MRPVRISYVTTTRTRDEPPKPPKVGAYIGLATHLKPRLLDQ
uniref:Uncharacterized protein n=1 Tax=Anopheles albimanus TaxID=7167 RepID=A0A182FYL7_ANOAL